MATPRPAMHAGQDSLGAVHCIYTSGVWKLFPFLLIYSIGFATLFPVIPTLVTNGFASQAAGHFVDCEAFTPATSPTECRNAHSQAVIWNSWTSFVSGSILSFIFAPFVGKASDHWGRKPFMLAGVTLALAPMVTLMFFIWGWLPIEWYYPMSALNGLVSSFSMCLTSVADLLHQAHRATAIGYLSACFSIGILVGPILGGYISTQSAVYVCIAMIGFTFLYVAVAVPETAPRVLAYRRARTASGQANDGYEEDQQLESPLLDDPSGTPTYVAAVAAQTLGEMDFDPIPNVVPHAHQHTLVPQVNMCDNSGSDSEETVKVIRDLPDAEKGHPGLPHSSSGGSQCAGGVRRCKSGSNPVIVRHVSDMLVGWRVIQGSSYYRKLVVIWVIVAMTWEGAQDLLFQYLQLQLGFNTRDQAHLLIMVAACGLIIKVFFLAAMVRILGEQKLLMLGLLAYMIEDVLLALAPNKLCALLAIASGSLSCVSWPASIALQTKHADPCDMGAVQGALSGISSLASGLGPIGFAALFSAFSRSDSTLPYYPQVVWYLAAGLSLVAIVLTGTLHWNEPETKSKIASHAQDLSTHSQAAAQVSQQTKSAGSDHA